MKTKSKYLSSGILLLIAAIVALQVPDGNSGILLLPLSRFVYYGLTFGSGIPFVVQIILLSGLFIIASCLVKLSFTGKFSFPGFGAGTVHHHSASGIVYFATQAQGNTTSLKKKPVPTREIQKKPETEQGILMIASGSIMFANKAFFKVSGYQPLDIFGKDFASLIRPDSLIHYTMMSRIPAAEIPNSPGIVLQSANGKNLVAYSGANVDSQYDPSGINIFYVKQESSQTSHDSSVDSMLFESIENVDTLHWIWDEKGILYMNNSCRHNLPFSLGLIISKPGLLMKTVLRKDRNTIREAISEYFNTGKFSQDVCCASDDGEVRYFRVNIAKRSIGNMLLQHHATAYDITDEKLTLLKAEAAAMEAEVANRNKTAFLANISHEIRSPLNGIIGFSELLADKNLTDAERERYLNIIQNNGNALISLLSDLIDISKLESGNLEISRHKFRPVKLLEDLKHQFESNSGGKYGEVSVVFAANSAIKDIEIESDSNRLRQVLVNLITNAKKFTTKGRIEIGADFSGSEMLFWVKDTGIGIPYDKQAAVFERFRQVDTPDTRPMLGFGLGLAISKALVELLGGHLWLESQPETGSLFAFTIKTNIINDTMETNHLKETGSSYPYDFREHTILIAEDIDFSFLYIEAVLRRTGIKILWAQNGKEAVEHIKSNSSIDLVMMDMHMPIMNGYEASEIVSGLRPELPIIAQTAFVLPEDVKKCYAAGCTGYLAKPIRKEQLLNTLAEYFEKMESREETMPLYRVNIG